MKRPDLRHVMLMMSGVNDIDLTGLEGLIRLTRDLKSLGVLEPDQAQAGLSA